MQQRSEICVARELAYRTTDGVEVTLLWHPVGDFVTVTVTDSKAGDRFELVLGEGDDAMDVFHHPYAYAAQRGLEIIPLWERKVATSSEDHSSPAASTR